MKKFLFLLGFLLSIASFSQNSKVLLKDKIYLPGKENIVLYYPKSEISKDSKVVFFTNEFKQETKSLSKNGDHYEFVINFPEKTTLLLLKVVGKDNKTIDDNSGKGFVVFLKKNPTSEENAIAIKEDLNGFFGLKNDEQSINAEYNNLYKKYPNLKNGRLYISRQLNKKPEDANVRKQAVNFANNQKKLATSEESLMDAFVIYRMLKMPDELEATKNLMVKKFPEGRMAKQDFINDFAKVENINEDIINKKFDEYSKKFPNDSDDEKKGVKDFLYGRLLTKYYNQKDFEGLKNLTSKFSFPLNSVFELNNMVWEDSGGNFTIEPKKELSFLENVSRYTLDIVKSEMQKAKNPQQTESLQGNYNMFADTLALILYKSGKFQEAFDYQNDIKLKDGLDDGGKSRYVVYALKAKGDDFAKEYLENEILKNHNNSKDLMQQLREIYQRKNLSFDDFEKINQENLKIATQKAKEAIIKKYGQSKSMDFTLTNLQSKTVKISDYRGKLIVLDFWATWCGPCRASFPHMKELVEKYQGKNVEFFFVNTWETQKPEQIKKNVAEFIKKNNYPFNVLLDNKDVVVKKYKIDGVPTKIVIDKNGEIISINASDENLVALIEENK